MLGRLQFASVVSDGVALAAGCVRLAALHEDLLGLLNCSPLDAAPTARSRDAALLAPWAIPSRDTALVAAGQFGYDPFSARAASGRYE